MAAERAKRGSLARLVQELAPGGRLVRARRLRGGVGARMDVLEVEQRDGARMKVSLRRFLRDNRSSQPEHVAREYRVLQLVGELGIPAPRPLLLDTEGRLFGVAAIAMTYLPGRPVYQPHNVASWADQLAAGLHRIHAVTPARFDLSCLGVHLRDGVLAELEARRPYAQQHGSLARQVHAVLTAEVDRIAWPAPTFVHDDYWPGNTIWQRGRLTGIIDWTHAEVGDPRTDVSQCRLDLALILDIGASESFLAAYQGRAARALPDVWYFDLYRGLRAILSYEFWLAGYHDAGLAHITPSHARERIESFLQRALAAFPTGSQRTA